MESNNFRLPNNFQKIEGKAPLIDIEKTIEDDEEIILFELPKNFDRKNLLNMKIKKIKTKSDHAMKVMKNYQALVYDSDHYLTNQNLSMFLTNNKKSFIFKPVDKYVKLFEKIEIPDPEVENIIPRRRSLKKILKQKTNKK